MVCILCKGKESSKQYPSILNVGEWFIRPRFGSSSDKTNKSSGTESERAREAEAEEEGELKILSFYCVLVCARVCA